MSRIPIRAYLGDQQLYKYAVRSSDYYERPKDWLVLPAAPEPQGVRALVAVFNGGANFFSILCQTAFTIDWGDGNVINYANNTTANYTYNYNNINPATECSRGYRQAIITITPQAGQNLTYVAFNRPAAAFVSNLNSNYNSSYLDMNINLPFLTTGQRLIIGGASIGGGKTLLERVYIKSWGNMNSLNGLFNFCTNLQSVNEHEWNLNNITNTSSMFKQCINLQSLDTTSWGSLSAVTNTSEMFSQCIKLRYIHNIENWKLSNVTNIGSMFFDASLLSPSDGTNVFDLSNWGITNNCTNLNTTFYGCFTPSHFINLKLDGWDTTNVTTADRTFFNTNIAVLNLSSWNLSACRQMGGFFSQIRSHTVYTPVLNLSSNPNIFDSTVGASTYLFATNSLLLQTIVFPNSGINSRITFNTCNFSASALNYIFENLSNDGAGKTINVTGNWGVSAVGYDQTIATNKGWTVVR